MYVQDYCNNDILQAFTLDTGCYWYLNTSPAMKHPDKIRKTKTWIS